MRPSPAAAAISAICAVIGFVTLTGSSPRQAGQEPMPRNPSPLRIAVDLIQVDATVTDAQGRHVPNLDAAEFELLQDNRPQTISAFQYVAAGTAALTGGGRSAPAAPLLPASAATRDAVRRTLAIVVDDLNLSFESTSRSQKALRKFIDTQMQPGDLVAIVRTAAGMGALQQFTTDRRALHAAADRVRWTMRGRMSSFGASELDDRLELFEKETAAAGTLGAVKYVMRGMAQLPGRKAILLLSDGFALTDSDARYGRILAIVRSVGDIASRAGVVIYGLDLRGLVATSPTAGEGSLRSGPVVQMQELAGTRESLDLLSAQTGGFLVKDRNDISAGFDRILDDQQGFYVLGYVPPGATLSATDPRFHSITVRVKRPGLRVRARRGFVGRPDSATPQATPANRMIAAVTSPFAGGDIRLRLTSFFGQSADTGAVVQSVMHVDARDLAFSEAPDGSRVAQVELLAMTFGDNGEVADQQGQNYTVRLERDRYSRALESGFVYTMRLRVKRPGPYQLRIALRDRGTDRIGSASQFVEVPDVTRGKLTLSSLFIQGTGVEGMAEGASDAVDANATVAVRRFRRGTQAAYACYVYNATRGPARKRQIESEVRMLRDGVVVFRSGPQAVSASASTADIAAAGILQLSAAITPGYYLLELSVTDRLAKKPTRVTQSIDFEVIE